MKKDKMKAKKEALDKMRKMKKVTVMADSEKGLKEGLSKAEDILGSKFMDGGCKDCKGCSKCSDPSPAEASKFMDGGTKKYDRFASDEEKEEKPSLMERLLSNPNKKKMEEGSSKKTGRKSLAERIGFGGKYSNGGYNDAYRNNKDNSKKMKKAEHGYESMEDSGMHKDEKHSKMEALKAMRKKKKY